MPLTEDQQSWLEIAQAKSADFAAFGEAMRLKNEELAKMSDDIARLQDDLKKASDDLKITFKEDDDKRFWERSKKQMDWKNGDKDSEVDTVHDLKDGYQVDPAKAKRVQKLHEELVAIQTRMENAKTPDGKPVFTAKDIERELWSPLVMADVIPSNAVGDKYSQDAQVWNGACELYEDRLKEHSKTASKYEDVQRGLRIATDVATLVGTVAAESIKAANFDGLSISAADKKAAADIKAIPEGNRSPEQVKALEAFTARELQATTAARDLQALQVATVVVNAGLGVTSNALDKPNDKKAWQIAEKLFQAIGDTAVASMGLASKQVAVSDPKLAGTAAFGTAMSSATSLISYGFKAGKVVFRVHDICEAMDEGGRVAAAQGLIKAVAGAVGDAFAAFDKQAGKDSSGQDVAADPLWGKIGGLVATGIIGASNAGFIAKQIHKSVQAGGLSNPSALVGAIGLTVVAPIMLGVFDQLSDVSRKDVAKGSESGDGMRNFEENPGDQVKNDLTGAKITPINDIMAKSMDLLKDSVENKENAQDLKDAVDAKKVQEAVQKALKSMPPLTELPPGMDVEDAKRQMAERLAKMEMDDKKSKIDDFKKQLRDDPKAKEAFFKEIKDASDAEIDKLNKLIGEASGSPEDMEDEAKAKKAMAAVDKLIMEAQALNQRWQTVEMLTAGGTAILVAALPVAGLAAAIAKMAMDVAILVRKSTELNKWMKNMALTMGNNSVYGPAIAGRLGSATVQVSQQAVRVVFDAIGVAAESAKLADCMGVATGLSIGNSMARALTEFAYKMHKEAEIDRGWQLYKDARENKGDRKKARKAMQWNSTLSKCVLAYGIVVDGDPIAKEVGRSCGLNPDVLADQKDVCGKVVTYFQTLYSDDPVVMKRIPLKKDWHPGSPSLSLDSWLRFKAAAMDRAKPNLAEGSARTPEADKYLAVLTRLLGADANFAKARDEKYPEADITDPNSKDKRNTPEYRKFLTETVDAANGLISVLRGWRPVTGAPGKDEKTPWNEGGNHDGMLAIAESLIAQAQMLVGEAGFEVKLLEEQEKAAAALKKAMDDNAQKLLDQAADDKEKEKEKEDA